MKNNAKKYISILYSTPFGVLLIIFALFPFVLNLAMSFTNYGLMRQDWNFVGIKNFRLIKHNTVTIKSNPVNHCIYYWLRRFDHAVGNVLCNYYDIQNKRHFYH